MRRKATVVIEREGRDKGGVFVLEEMPAMPATEWFIRAGQLLARSGTDIPANIGEHGATGFVALGMGAIITGLGKAPWNETKPLLDQLLTCVQSYTPPGGTMALTGWHIIVTQIEEAATILQLYEEVLSLLLGFSLRASLSAFGQRLMTMISSAIGPNTETSPERSESSSPAASPA